MVDVSAHLFAPITTSKVVRIDLPDGTMKFRLAARAAGGAGTGSSTRDPARIITMAWGERYVADLLAVTIPAVLAPGNVPAFAAEFDCEFVIVTEMRLFQQIITAPAIQRLLEYCDLRLVPIDDLLSPWYGITLTYALVRGFADLGEAMTATHLVFLNADFIVADGSYRRLAELIRQGERLVVSPSYCMVLEQTITKLRRYYDEQACSLAIAKRDMAALILENRHNTIRAKTANQRLFRIHRYDQLYWYVDDHTLLSRQMPIAVVYMRPERVLTELPTFWDYGVISEYCPTVAPCVLGDSDDFLMGELRTASTFREMLHLGWPSTEEIVSDLSSFTTKDHHDYGRHILALHCRDLPEHIELEKSRFQQVMDDIDHRLQRPTDYRSHPFWIKDISHFLEDRDSKRERLLAALDTRARLQSSPAIVNAIEAVQSEMTALLTQRLGIEEEYGRREKEWADTLAKLQREFEHETALRTQHLDRMREERASALAALQSRYTDLERKREEIFGSEMPSRQTASAKAEISSDKAEISNAGAGSILSEIAELTPIRAQRKSSERESSEHRRDLQPRKRSGERQSSHWIKHLGPIYRRLFGRLPQTTKWHPYYLVLDPACRSVISMSDRAANVVVISSGGAIGSLLTRPLRARVVTVTPQMVIMGLYDDFIENMGHIDLCICDLGLDDLLTLRQMLDNLRPRLAQDAKIVVFHQNLSGSNLDSLTYDFTNNTFPLFGRSRVIFSGSLLGAVAARWFHSALYRYNVFRLRGALAFMAVLVGCAPLARLASWWETRRDPEKLPRHCISMVIEIDMAG